MAILAKSSGPGFVPMLKGYSLPCDLSEYPQLTVSTSTIYNGVAGGHEFNLLSYITFFSGKFFALWASASFENAGGQHIMYSTSADGITWNAAANVTPPQASGWMQGGCGLWVRESDLYALYRSSEVGSGPEGDTYYGPSLALKGKKWNGTGWDSEENILTDCTLDDHPFQLRTGEWYATGRDKHFKTIMIKGDIGNWSRVMVSPPPETPLYLLNECTILPIDDGSVLSYEYRIEETMPLRFLYRSFSTDFGKTISVPRATNFPNARSRRCSRALSDGRYVICSNMSDASDRKKLMLAVSDDGYTYDRCYMLRGETTVPNFTFPPVDYRTGYNYPQVFEKDGVLHIIYSRNKEDIQVSRISMASFT